jgi:hypothetical protein
MAQNFHVQVELPTDQKSWQPAMVRKVGGDVLVEVHRYKNRVRVVPGYQDDNRARVLFWACRTEGVEQACLCWSDIWAEWSAPATDPYRPAWMQRCRSRAVLLARTQRPPVSRCSAGS